MADGGNWYDQLRAFIMGQSSGGYGFGPSSPNDGGSVITKLLGQLPPAPSPSVSASTPGNMTISPQVSQSLVDSQKAEVARQLELQGHSSGLSDTFAPESLMFPKGMASMSSVIGALPFASQVGKEIGTSLKQFDSFDMKKSVEAVAGALMGLPFLMMMAGGKGGPAKNELIEAGYQNYITHEPALTKYAEATAKKLGVDASMIELDKLLASVGAAKTPSEALQFGYNNIKQQLIKAKEAETGRGPVKRQIESIDSPNAAQVEQKIYADKPTTPYDRMVVDNKSWKTFDLRDRDSAVAYRKDVLSELKSVEPQYVPKLGGIINSTVDELYNTALKGLNKKLPAEDAIKANFKARDRLQLMLKQYFIEGVGPSRLYDNLVRREYQPGMSTQGIPYKSAALRESGLMKFFKNDTKTLSDSEFYALLDMGLNKVTNNVIDFVESKRGQKSLRK